MTKFPCELGKLMGEVGEFEQMIKAFRRIRRVDKRVVSVKIVWRRMFL